MFGLRRFPDSDIAIQWCISSVVIGTHLSSRRLAGL